MIPHNCTASESTGSSDALSSRSLHQLGTAPITRSPHSTAVDGCCSRRRWLLFNTPDCPAPAAATLVWAVCCSIWAVRGICTLLHGTASTPGARLHLQPRQGFACCVVLFMYTHEPDQLRTLKSASRTTHVLPTLPCPGQPKLRFRCSFAPISTG